MSNIKKQLLKEIEAKIARKKQKNNKTIYNYALSLIKNIEDINSITRTKYEWELCATLAINNFKNQLITIDSGASCNVLFKEDDNKKNIDRIIIRWSDQYRLFNKIESELILDIMEIILNEN